MPSAAGVKSSGNERDPENVGVPRVRWKQPKNIKMDEKKNKKPQRTEEQRLQQQWQRGQQSIQQTKQQAGVTDFGFSGGWDGFKVGVYSRCSGFQFFRCYSRG